MPELVPDPTSLSRVELLQLAQSLGVSDADVMTRAELRAAIDKARRPEPPSVNQQPITWVSVARRLLASVVERGLNLPDAASLIRGDTKLNSPPKAPPPVATVTLARIYGAQGHIDRAIATLDEVLQSDPDHELARDLRNQLEFRRTELLARQASAAPTTPAVSNGLPKSGGWPQPAEAVSPGSALAGTSVEVAGAPLSEPRSVEPPPFVELGPQTEPGPYPATPPFAAASQTVVEQPPFAEQQPLTAQQTPTESRPFAELDSLGEAPPSVQPPAFLDSPPRPGPESFEDGDIPQQPRHSGEALALADSVPAVEPAPLGEPSPSLEAPASVDVAPSADAPPLDDGPPLDDAPALDDGPPLDDAEARSLSEAITSIPPALSPDVNAELVAPSFDVVDASVRPTEAVGQPPPAFYTEPPTSLGAMPPPGLETAPHPSVDLETEPPATIASQVELPPPVGGEAARAAVSAAEPSHPSPEIPHALNGLSNGASVSVPPASGETFAEAGAGFESGSTLPHVPGLVLIETDTAVRYVYWELAAASLGAPHWIHVVSHTPTPHGDSERHERHFPVHRQLGALRLEGVPLHAIVRARLTLANDGRPLVVAGAVRPRAPGAGPFEIRYTPHPSAKPEALATRAQPLLERASAVYWDW
jgi:hypothetical protein